MANPIKHVDPREELASALTHGLGATAALAGGAILITLAALHGDRWQLGAAIVFGIALLALYVPRRSTTRSSTRWRRGG